jgi:hypothetical protein
MSDSFIEDIQHASGVLLAISVVLLFVLPVGSSWQIAAGVMATLCGAIYLFTLYHLKQIDKADGFRLADEDVRRAARNRRSRDSDDGVGDGGDGGDGD